MVDRIIPVDENNLFSSLKEKYKGVYPETLGSPKVGLFGFSQEGIFR